MSTDQTSRPVSCDARLSVHSVLSRLTRFAQKAEALAKFLWENIPVRGARSPASLLDVTQEAIWETVERLEELERSRPVGVPPNLVHLLGAKVQIDFKASPVRQWAQQWEESRKRRTPPDSCLAPDAEAVIGLKQAARLLIRRIGQCYARQGDAPFCPEHGSPMRNCHTAPRFRYYRCVEPGCSERVKLHRGSTGSGSGRTNRPVCPAHGKLMRASRTAGRITYYRCPIEGCDRRAKRLRDILPFLAHAETPPQTDGNGQAGSASPNLQPTGDLRLAAGLILGQKHPDWSDRKIEKEAGFSKGGLTRKRVYREAMRLARSPRKLPARGTRDGETGQFEAWEDPSADGDADR